MKELEERRKFDRRKKDRRQPVIKPPRVAPPDKVAVFRAEYGEHRPKVGAPPLPPDEPKKIYKPPAAAIPVRETTSIKLFQSIQQKFRGWWDFIR